MRNLAHIILNARGHVAAAVLALILLGAGFTSGYLWRTPAEATPPPAGPLVCGVAEDSQPVDCRTGQPLDYRDGGWWLPNRTPQVGPTAFGCGDDCETPDTPAGQLDGLRKAAGR